MTTDRRPAGFFVRSWDTDVPVGRTKHAFEDLLRRYGATGFTVSEDYASRTVVVAFSLAVGGEQQEIRLPVSYTVVLRRLRQMPEFVKKAGRYNNREAWEQEQAARVAWRHLILWAEATLSAVDAGLYTLQEAFFAHTMIPTPGGGAMPAVDAVNAIRRLTAGGAG